MKKDFPMRIRIQARSYFSQEHIKAAALFTRQTYQIEEDYRRNGVINDELIEDHRSFVSGAVFATVSFIEASINELFADALEHPGSDITVNIDPDTKLLLAQMSKLRVLRPLSTLPKFQMALSLSKKGLLDEGGTPYQDVNTLIVIRNTLIHSEPFWERGEETAIDKQILHLQQANRFSLNPLRVGRTNSFFPDLCLSHGCAEWGVKKSLELVTLFSSRIGATIIFDANNPRLKTQPESFLTEDAPKRS